MLHGRILITGGAGFLARAIYARAERENWPAEFTCVSRDDAKHVALQQRFHVRCYPFDLGLADDFRLEALMLGHDLVIHAAAMKYVDLAEGLPSYVVQTNIDGSEQVARAAMRAGVPRVIGISTDKAVEPVNIYGMTKAVMERLFAEADTMSDTEFVCVRYGNVVGSTGSVIPLFEHQLKETGVLTLTDPRMTRFWMSVEEAIDTIVYAAEMAPPSTVVIPKPRALSLKDLAHVILGDEERSPIDEDRMQVIGPRPGEKRHEKLLHRQESLYTADTGEGFYLISGPSYTSYKPLDDPFEVTSDEPPAGLLGLGEMRDYIEAAREI